MRLTVTWLVAVLVLAIPFLADAQDKKGKQWSEADVRARVSKEWTYDFRSPNKTVGRNVWKPDGTLSVNMTLPDGNKMSDAGTWRQEGQKVCVKYTKVRGGKEYCVTFHDMGDYHESRLEDGSVSVRFKL